MRIVSWNMRKNKKAWDYFFESLNPDIALLQETSPLNDDYQFNVINKNVKKNLNNSILFKTATNNSTSLMLNKFYRIFLKPIIS